MLLVNLIACAWVTHDCVFLPILCVTGLALIGWRKGDVHIPFIRLIGRPRDLMGGILLVYRVIHIGQYSIIYCGICI